MKKFIISSAIILACFISKAQKTVTIASPDDKKVKEYDEIVIKRKDTSKDGKVLIEIRNEQVLVDGKPIDKYEGDQFIVKKRSPNRYNLVTSPSQFRFDDDTWSTEENENDVRNGEEDRAFLGILTEGSSEGVRITRVTENSAAAKAGLKEGDVITKINDKAVFDHEQLSKAIGGMKPDEKVTINYKRDGRENKTTATLGKISTRERIRKFQGGPMPRIEAMPQMDFNFDENGDFQNMFHGRPRLGIKAQDTEEGKGVKVVEVDEDSPAGKAGIKEDDIITSFEGKEVNSADDLVKISKESKEKSTLKVQLKRNGKTENLEIRVPKKLKTANL